MVRKTRKGLGKLRAAKQESFQYFRAQPAPATKATTCRIRKKTPATERQLTANKIRTIDEPKVDPLYTVGEISLNKTTGVQASLQKTNA